MPQPGSTNDVVQLGVTGLPAEFADGPFGAGDEDGGIAGAARVNFGGYGVAGHAAGRFNDLADAETLAIS
jgi:hypothetical protein